MQTQRWAINTAVWLLSLTSLSSCGVGTLPPAPPPRRPAPPSSAHVLPKDCNAPDPSPPPALAYEQRSTVESSNLSRQGDDLLRKSATRGVPAVERDHFVTQAAQKYVMALSADPYNAGATYELSAIYASINRRQCALTLLARLVDLRLLASHQADVEEKVDHLLGRGRWANNLDPRFSSLRQDARFRDLVPKLK